MSPDDNGYSQEGCQSPGQRAADAQSVPVSPKGDAPQPAEDQEPHDHTVQLKSPLKPDEPEMLPFCSRDELAVDYHIDGLSEGRSLMAVFLYVYAGSCMWGSPSNVSSTTFK
jgi:hypothetical protein